MRPRFPRLELWELDPDGSSKESPPWLEVCLSLLSEETEQITLCFLHRLCAPRQGIYFHLLQFMLIVETWCSLKKTGLSVQVIYPLYDYDPDFSPPSFLQMESFTPCREQAEL